MESGNNWNYADVKKLSKTNYSTLNLMVPPDLWGSFQKIRIPNISPLRCGPHISLGYPFVEEKYFEPAKEVLENGLKDFKPFKIKFEKFGVFSHRYSSTLYLEPETEPKNALQDLEAAIVKLFPQCDDQYRPSPGGKKKFSPHCSMGSFKSHDECLKVKAEAEKTWVPVSFLVTEINLLARNGNDPYKNFHTIKFMGYENSISHFDEWILGPEFFPSGYFDESKKSDKKLYPYEWISVTLDPAAPEFVSNSKQISSDPAVAPTFVTTTTSTPINSIVSKTINYKKRYPKLGWPYSEENVCLWFEKDWKKEAKNARGEPDEPTLDLKKSWAKQQLQLAKLVSVKNELSWKVSEPDASGNVKMDGLKYVGGVDISFAKNSKIDACASVVICEYPSMKVVFETYYMIKLTQPYVAGFLAFREVPHVVEILENMKKEVQSILPQVIIVDGNGILHMRGLGQACHLGVLTGIPCIGVAKKLLVTDGIDHETVEQGFLANQHASSEDQQRTVLLKATSGQFKAAAYRVPKTEEVVYISPGHKIDLSTAISVVKSCYMGQDLPEPTFQADKLSRLFLALNYDNPNLHPN